MNLIRNDKVLFSEGFLYMGGITTGDTPVPPQEIYRDRKLGDMMNMMLNSIANMTLEELKYIKEFV